jgi:2-keto-4-pentenoate hydratase
MISSTREAELRTFAKLCVEARSTATPLTSFPAGVEPTTQEEANFAQDAITALIEPKGSAPARACPARAWKIGAPASDATPSFGPMIAAWIVPDASVLADKRIRLRGLEAEVAFKLGKPLPPRSTPYTRAEVIDAIESCHPVIEELESALPFPKDGPKLTANGDLGMHGGFIYGPAVANWQSIDLTKERVTLSLDGKVEVDRVASNSAGTDLLRMLVYLANEGATRTGGLEKGSWITTGSWTGNTFAKPGQTCTVQFANVGKVSVKFA